VTKSGPETPRYYTRIADLLKSGEAEPVQLSDVNERVRLAASESVRAHLLADVEVGVFLSAGIDSGAILGLMRDAGIEKVTAITLAFTEFRNTGADEAPLARELAEYYGAKHIVRYVDEAEFISDLPHILNAMDQPTIDGINTWFVAKAAKEAGIKVALSGVGADELLGGYPSFYSIPRSVNAFGVPAAIPGLGSLVRQAARCMGIERFSPKLPGLIEYGGTYPGAYLLKRGLFMPWQLSELLENSAVVRDGLSQLSPLNSLASETAPTGRTPFSRVAALETVQYMRNQLLRDTDWAGMAHGVEIRTPFADIDFLKNLSPVIPLLDRQAGKHALGLSPSRPLPIHIINRRKTGFDVPFKRWVSKSNMDRRFGTSGKAYSSRDWGRFVLDHYMATAS
jgi:asparagine synthase (glutamine-hydrolysing)